MKLLKKRLGVPALALLLALALTIGTVSATAVLIYEWQLSLTAATPKVRFYKWSDQSYADTVTLNYNLYANLWLYDDNAAYGIKNTDSSAHTVYLYIDSISDPSKVENITVRILDGETEMAKVTWQGGGLPTSKVNFDAAANTAYTLEVWIKGASTVASVTVNLKMEVSES